MLRLRAFAARTLLGISLFFLSQTADAFITRLTPLKEVLASQQYIFTARVEKIDPDKPAVVLTFDDDLKGKTPFRRLPVNLTGDSEGKKEKHGEQLLKRLAPKLPVVIFAEQRGKRVTAFGYTNGTWFQMLGQAGDDPAAATWSFTHCEPYLRRTFKGTTAELIDVIRDGLAGKKAPPEPDPKEPPGLGPEVNTDGETRRRGDKESRSVSLSPRLLVSPSLRGSSPLFAVIPTFVLIGPLALLASIFGLGGLALVLKRWMVLLSMLCTASTLFLLHAWFRGYLQDSWWGTPAALWTVTAVCMLLGAGWSWQRYRAALRRDAMASFTAGRAERIAFGVVGLLGVGCVLYVGWFDTLFLSPWRELLLVWVAAWVGLLHLLWDRFADARHVEKEIAPYRNTIFHGKRYPYESVKPSPWRPWVSTEIVVLGALALACVGIGIARPPRPSGAEAVTVAWTFEAKDRGMIASTPLVTADCVYVGAAHSSGFTAFGALYCLEKASGQLLWTFNDDDGMKQVFSSPCVAAGRLYIGEGFHQDASCKLYCLDAATGQKLWDFATSSHVESSPTVVDGRVYFGAGDDGVYCLDAVTGKEIWHFQGPHVDTSPAVSGKRLYGGSGYGNYEVFCLDLDTGKPMWRIPLDLPAFAAPVVSNEQVFFGVGNGDFVKSDDKPAGAVLCIDTVLGRRLWRCDLPDAVHGRPAVDPWNVYCGSRDGHCYAINRMTGDVVWKHGLGDPIVASPVIVEKTLFVAASSGNVCRCVPDEGNLLWQFDLANHARAKCQLLAMPVLDGKRLIVAAGIDSMVSRAAVVYCLELPDR